MPELPEVETVRRGLAEILKSQPVLSDIEFRRENLREPFPVKQLRALRGARIQNVLRRGKYLIFVTERGGILSHLGMTGSWREWRASESLGPHDHVLISFSNETNLVYRDPRRFGLLDWVEIPFDSHPRLKNLGPEPFEAEFHAAYLWQLCQLRSASIKSVLMDASTVVGVGNIYASEALHRAGIRPMRAARKVRREEIQRLIQGVREVLDLALRAGGSSISDYRRADGEKGHFQNEFLVYDREEKSCLNCGKKIRRIILSGRSSFYCPHCQK